jgi:Zn-dependent protease with chaperone function
VKKYSQVWIAATLLLAACDAPSEPAVTSTGHWEISAEYVSNTMLKSEDAIAEGVKYKQIAQLNTGDLPEGVYSRYRRMAKKMRLKPPPALYLDALDEGKLPQALARFTREGRPLVIINQSALLDWSPRQLVAVLGHELVHLKERHVTAENLALAYNHPELSVAHELEADRVGSGPLGSCDPEALKAALQIVFDIDKKELVDSNVIASVDDYENLTGTDHPNRQQRLATLDEMAQNPPVGCK